MTDGERGATGAQAPLRVAIMINEPTLARWQRHLLRKIEASGHGRLVLVLVRARVSAPPAPAARSALAASLFQRFTRWDRKRFRHGTDPFERQPLEALEFDAPVWTLSPETTVWSDRLSEKDMDRLRAEQIDLIIRFGWRILRGAVLDVAPLGIWSYHHGDNRVNRGGPPCFWETLEGQSCTGLTLQRLEDNVDDGRVLARAFTATDPVSVNLTRLKLYWLSVDLIPRQIALLRKLGADRYWAEVEQRNQAPAFYSQPLLADRNLDLITTVRHVARRLGSFVKTAVFERMFDEKWVLYFRLGNSLSTSMWQFQRLESPDDRYWADPHVIARDGRFYVFVEEFLYATARAHIALIVIESDGTVGEARTVLKEPHHLSYPFVFEYDGKTWMIPETGQHGTINLYECTRFPDRWEHRHVLMENVYAVDTTLHWRDGRWWMFTTLSENAGRYTHDELHVFSSTDLYSSQWQRHPRNAVVTDPRCARPAGPLFESEGQLYRPGQDCSRGYGYALHLQHITQLDQEHYAEHEASRITPDWDASIKGVHTLCYVPGLTIVDAKTYRRRSSLG